jgi:uncharacterized protein (DUF1501 family)
VRDPRSSILDPGPTGFILKEIIPMSEIKIATRREFLKYGLGLVGIGTTLPNFLIRTALAGPQAEPNQRVMVVLQLHGGNDAMSTLVPYGHKEYHEYRKTTKIREEEVIKLNDELGLHPNLKGWKEFLEEGAFAAIPGVGYPNPNYSHFTATDTWMMADPRGRQLPYGWVGRACDVGFKGNPDPKLAIAVGIDGASPALLGKEHPGILVSRPESFGYGGTGNSEQQAALYKKLNEAGTGEMTGELQWVTSTAIAANAAAEAIRRLGVAYRPKVQYPDTAFGRNLRVVAGLIVGGLSTRIYWTGREGRFEFDTHGNQRPRHDSLMAELNEAVTAFFKDLKQQGQAQRVLLFTISEFGRTSKENGSQGTDHAAAAAQFLFGPGVKAGIHGKHPSLSDLIPTGSSLKHTTDFRSIYATVLEKWLRIPSEPVLGRKWPLIDCIA